MVASNSANAGFQPASLPTPADELLGRLLLARPIEDRDFDTRHGPSTATITQVIVIDDDTGVATDLGERALFWQLVRRELAAATDEEPWIAGRLVKSGQAYLLDSPTEAELAVLARVLEQHSIDE
jgi:hypothetical protein